MSEMKSFAVIAERDITASGLMGPEARQAWINLPEEDRSAFVGAANFLGCAYERVDRFQTDTVPEKRRLMMARLMLLKLGLYQCEPRWSSSVLATVTSNVLEVSGGSVSDLYFALYELLGDYGCELSATLANFIKDVVIQCFNQHRSAYQKVDWKVAAAVVNERSSKAQLYLAALAIPPEELHDAIVSRIKSNLESTRFGPEVGAILMA